MLISGLSSSPAIQPINRAPVAQSQPLTRAADSTSIEAATRVARDQGAQAPINVQRVDPSNRNDGTRQPRAPAASGAEAAAAQIDQLTQAERRQLAELRTRDREVRAHEAAHQAVAGRFAGPVQFEFQRGPDGQLYAVGGSVQIDTSPVPGDPQATIDKMETIRAAALAPGNPSAQDQAVAAQALQQLVQARAELAAARGAGNTDSTPTGTPGGADTGPVGSINQPSEPFSAVNLTPSLAAAPPGPARAAALAFNEIEQFGRPPAPLPIDARLAVDLFA
ncbi:MAG: putative metalloprotease CJM1_0395 family protein [Wenzhouxiangellaceae bacterium]|nr:putative metalloprotease CJM1_0395 family protein [Wenzhouxiangellaceae bacterium]